MPETPAPDPAAAIVAQGAEFDGLVLLRGPGRIDGRVRGHVVGSELVWIGETARVEARVDAGDVVVAGQVEGDVRARGCIEVLAGARVRGSLEAPRLRLAEGCVVEGPCHTGPVAGAEGPCEGPASP